MADNSIIIYSSYSIVLFEYAKSENAIKQYFEQAKWLLKILTAQKHYLHIFLSDCSISKSNRKQIIDHVVNKKISEKFKYFLYTIIDFNRAKSLVKIIEKFLDLCGKDLHILNVRVYSPFELNTKLDSKLKKSLEKYYQSKVNIEHHIDANLIGGIKIETDHGSIDNTYQSKLKNLKEALTKSNQNKNN